LGGRDPIIDQAVGIVRSRRGGNSDDAFAVLRTISQTENKKITTIAKSIVDDAVGRANHRKNQQP
jgi:AmiR/NasT family two-component response regulator